MKEKKFFDMQTSWIMVAIIVLFAAVVYGITTFPIAMPSGESTLYVRVNTDETLAEKTHAVTTVSQGDHVIETKDVSCNDDTKICTLGEGSYQMSTKIYSEDSEYALGINENTIDIGKSSEKEMHFEYNYFLDSASG